VFRAGFGLFAPSIAVTIKPNQDLWNAAKNFALVGLLGVLVGGVLGVLVAGLGLGLSGGLVRGLGLGLVAGLGLGLVLGLPYGGLVCLRHFTLRLLLCWHGHMPWNYARFLDQAVAQRLLQRVGGGYIFSHRLLLEHFAALTDEQIRDLLN
jgi:hypothetical protein